jgi:hypothetical protein
MDFNQICQNDSAFSVRCLPIDDHRGAEGVVVIAKLGFRVSARGVVTWSSAPVRLVDEPGGPRGSIRYPNDYVFAKPGTDVILVGTAYPPVNAPGAAPATEMDVSLRVGALEKTVRVHGPRVYYEALGVLPGRPGPLEPVPLVYELTYGGLDTSDPMHAQVERRNPLGLGFAVDRKKLVGTPVPPIEDPRAPLGARSPAPAGFGVVGADWEPRSSFSGTYDERWQRERAPVHPTDFDLRHNSYASAGLWSAVPLGGDEPIELLGATPEGAWRFQLPKHEPEIACVLAGERRVLSTYLDTLLIDADEKRIELSYRAFIALPRKSELLQRIVVSSTTALPDSVLSAEALRIDRLLSSNHSHDDHEASA